MEKQIFKGKTAIWFYAAVVIYNVAPLSMNDVLHRSWFFYLIFVFYYAFDIFWFSIIVRNRIEADDTSFTFFYGFQKQTYLIQNVKLMKRTKSCIASSANSLDRIYIDLGGDELYVSLQDNDGFIRYIKERQKQSI